MFYIKKIFFFLIKYYYIKFMVKKFNYPPINYPVLLQLCLNKVEKKSEADKSAQY